MANSISKTDYDLLLSHILEHQKPLIKLMLPNLDELIELGWLFSWRDYTTTYALWVHDFNEQIVDFKLIANAPVYPVSPDRQTVEETVILFLKTFPECPGEKTCVSEKVDSELTPYVFDRRHVLEK